MYLAPQHFQAQNRYFEDSLRAAVESLWFRPYGLAGCKLDAEALRNGTVAVVHARGILEDGLCFHAPDCDPLPSPLPIPDRFPPTSDRLTIFLAAPEFRNGGANCAFADQLPDSHRYVAEERFVPDDNTGAGDRPVVFGRKNLALFTAEDLPSDRVALPIARVLRNGAGGFVYDPDFIPPLLQIAASEGLMLRLRRLIEILDEKSASLAPAGDRGAGDFSTRNTASFWLLHAINSGLVALRHLWASKRGHPEELFLEMSRLGGALCTFAAGSHPRSLPGYDHRRLSECFDAVDRHIREHLNVVLPSNCLTIPLRSSRPYFFEGAVTDSRVFGRAEWILGVRAGIGQAALITSAPQLIKVCSSRFVAELVKRALPGLPLKHLAVPPPAISRKVETQYFAVGRTGPAWDDIVQTRQVGIYVPGEFPQAELELSVVLDA
jgi:type VI secretion system protein ImpJ